MLDPNSRYYNIETAQLEQGAAQRAYLTRRMLPAPAAQTTLEEYQVAGSERLDPLGQHGLWDHPGVSADRRKPVLHPSELLVAGGAFGSAVATLAKVLGTPKRASWQRG